MVGVSPLIRPDRLAELLAGPEPPVVLDVRWRLGGPPARPDHLAGHIPGAVFLDLGTELAGPPVPAPGSGGRHPLPAAEDLARVFAAAGVGADSVVVAHDDADGSVAARAWWLLRWLGLPADRVAVLDGGWAAWVAGGYPVATGESRVPAPGELGGRGGAMPVLDADAAGALAGTGVLLDARAAARYRGDTEPVDPRAGHIPGARGAPFGEHLGPDGHWRTPEELAGRFAGLGVSPDTPVGAYCGSGVTACSVVLALEYAGLRPPDAPAALYAGSWSEWSGQPHRPAATGPEPGGT
jgi:thiosulfate/3-mercaptopyruvate sulfurtransferase